MPGQILMQGAKAKLLDAKLGRISLDQAVKVEGVLAQMAVPCV